MVFMCPELSDLSTTLLQEWQGLYCFTRWSEASVIRPKHAFCSKEERGMERYLWPFFFSQPQKATYGTFPMLFKWKTPSVLTFFPDTPEIFPLMTLVKLCFTRISAPWYQEPVNKKGWLASLPYTELCGSGMCQVFFGLMTSFFFSHAFKDPIWIYMILGPSFLNMATHSGLITSEKVPNPCPTGCVNVDWSHDLHSSGLIWGYLRLHEMYSTDLFLIRSFLCTLQKTSFLQSLLPSCPRYK